MTGASEGIGKHIALSLAAEGFSVQLAARSVDKLEAVKKSIEAKQMEGRVTPIDLTGNSIRQITAERDVMGDLAIVVNNAGVMNPHRFLTQDPAILTNENKCNMRAITLLTKAAIAHSEKTRANGKKLALIQLSSVISNSYELPMWGHYSGTKLYDKIFGQMIQASFEGKNIETIIVYPGAVTTNLNNHMVSPGANSLPADCADGVLNDLSCNWTGDTSGSLLHNIQRCFRLKVSYRPLNWLMMPAIAPGAEKLAKKLA